MLYDPKWEQPTKTETPLRKILTTARMTITEPGSWCQTYESGAAICAVHAIQRAIFGDPTNFSNRAPRLTKLEIQAVTALGTAMGIANPNNGIDVGEWNDSHTHTEVLAAFDKAIASA